MTAHAESGIRAGGCDGVIKGWPGRHEGCGGESVCLVKLGNGAVDARGEAEVVCVDDEAGHEWVGLAIFERRTVNFEKAVVLNERGALDEGFASLRV